MNRTADKTGGPPSSDARETRSTIGLHRYSIVVALGAMFVLVAGASVTSTGSGLSVPDWPLSYGKLNPPMVGGVFYEHGHRLVAGTLALLLMGMTVWTWRVEPRPWVRYLSLMAVVLVLAQAVLGGLTVLLLLPTSISVAHASLAMLLFGVVVSFAAVTSPAWQKPGLRPQPRAGRFSLLAGIVLGILCLQILLGAVMRHTGAGLACPDFPLCNGQLIPPLRSFHIAIHFAHRMGGVVVSIAVGLMAWGAHHWLAGERAIRRLMILSSVVVVTQFALGVASVLTRLDPAMTVAHHVGGAALLALVTLTTLWSARLAHLQTTPVPEITNKDLLRSPVS